MSASRSSSSLPASAPSTERVPALFSWSGGKDCARALDVLQQSGRHAIEALVCSTSSLHRRVSMHGVREELIEAQARMLGLPLEWIVLPTPCSNVEYERVMQQMWTPWIARRVTTCGFGDLFLADLRAWREAQLARLGMSAVFPLWGRDTRELIEEFVALGFRAVVVAAAADKCPASFVGRELDASFLEHLPPGVDPCGENGEFHTYVYDAPRFEAPVRFTRGERVLRDGMWYVDLVPA